MRSVALALIAAECAWDRPPSDAGNTNANPFEVTIGVTNVASLAFDHRTTTYALAGGLRPARHRQGLSG